VYFVSFNFCHLLKKSAVTRKVVISLRSNLEGSGLASSGLEREPVMDGKTLKGLRVAQCVGNVLTSWDSTSFPTSTLLHLDVYILRE